MARKTLLTEGEIRQFMKLANLGPLGDEKIQEMGGMPYNRDEEEAMGDELSDMDSEADREGDEIDDLEGDLDVADGDGEAARLRRGQDELLEQQHDRRTRHGVGDVGTFRRRHNIFSCLFFFA